MPRMHASCGGDLNEALSGDVFARLRRVATASPHYSGRETLLV